MREVGDLDHAVILVRDLEAARRRYEELGFRTTPPARHSAPMGTGNTTIVLPDRRTYVELLGVHEPTPANAAQRARLARREGLHGLAFKTEDAQAAATAFAAAGIAEGDAVAFGRPVELAQGVREARFTVARTSDDAIPGAWCFVCRHHTPDLVWREGFLDHPNGARALVEVVGVAPDPASIEPAWRLWLGERVRRTAEGFVAGTGTARILFGTPDGVRARLGNAPAEPALDEPALVALIFAVDDTAPARATLAAAGIAVVEAADGTLLVPAAAACGVVIGFRPVAAE